MAMDVPASAPQAKETKESEAPGLSLNAILDGIRSVARAPYAIALGVIIVCVFVAFWPLLSGLPSLWLENEYYTHGFLVPLICAYMVYRKWPKIKDTPVKPGLIAALFIVGGLYLLRASEIADVKFYSSIAFLMVMLGIIWGALGWAWLKATAVPVLYSAFALPIWTSFISDNTNPLQLMSTRVAYEILRILGLDPMTDSLNKSIIYLNSYTLDIGVPCSGMKLLLAVTAFTIFFIVIGGLKWWANLIMFAMVFPLSLFINGMRIALIGIVGDQYGADAGQSFHDWSGYIMLVVCFIILFRFGRLLGWKG